MNYLTQILFFFGAIGAFNSVIVAIYLLTSNSYSKLENRIFGLFLLIVSLRVIKSLFYAFSTKESIWYLNFGPAFFLLISPLLFTYVVSIAKRESFWVKKWKIHMLCWISIVVLLMTFIPFTENVQLNKKTILPIINVQWLCYILLSGFYVKNGITKGKQLSIKHKWLLIFLTINLILWLCFALIKFDYFVIGSIVYSLFFYPTFLFFLFKKKVTSKIFEKNKVIKNAHISEESEQLIDDLKSLMITEKLYTNPDIKINTVAQKLGISSHELSKLINENLHNSFTEFINKYRIEEAKQLIGTKSHYTIEAIGNLSGFNSKSAFYKSFKIHTGTTPAKFNS